VVARDADAHSGHRQLPDAGRLGAAQLIRFDGGASRCRREAPVRPGSLKTSHVLKARWAGMRAAADEVIRVSFGPQTSEANVAAVPGCIWRGMAKARAA
jgi:hypothetical protein